MLYEIGRQCTCMISFFLNKIVIFTNSYFNGYVFQKIKRVQKMEKEIKEENKIVSRGDNKIVIQNSENSDITIKNSIDAKGNNNIVIQNSGSSKITIDGKEY